MERHKQQSTNRMPAGRPFCTDTYNAEKNCHTDLNALLTSGIAAFSLITALRACVRACVRAWVCFYALEVESYSSKIEKCKREVVIFLTMGMIRLPGSLSSLSFSFSLSIFVHHNIFSPESSHHWMGKKNYPSSPRKVSYFQKKIRSGG